MKYNNIIFLGLCLGLTTYSALSADSVIKISGRVLDYGCTVSSDSLNFTVVDLPLYFQTPVIT
ncbi:type 1 fimbrial protein [Escherichia coli]|nr:type 1 fimbrial protein [Escherichia coli]